MPPFMCYFIMRFSAGNQKLFQFEVGQSSTVASSNHEIIIFQLTASQPQLVLCWSIYFNAARAFWVLPCHVVGSTCLSPAPVEAFVVKMCRFIPSLDNVAE